MCVKGDGRCRMCVVVFVAFPLFDSSFSMCDASTEAWAVVGKNRPITTLPHREGKQPLS